MTKIDAREWALEATDRGTGEILLTSMDRDGTKVGFEIELTRTISELVTVPVIASGGAGNAGHFAEVFNDGDADAGLAASIFHYSEVTIPELKRSLDQAGIPIRVTT